MEEDDFESHTFYAVDEYVDWDFPLSSDYLKILLHEAYYNSGRLTRGEFTKKELERYVNEADAGVKMDAFCKITDDTTWEIFKKKHLVPKTLTREEFTTVFRRLWRNKKIRKVAHLIPIYMLAYFGLPVRTLRYDFPISDDYVTFHELVNKDRFRSQRLFEIITFFKKHCNKPLMLGVD